MELEWEYGGRFGERLADDGGGYSPSAASKRARAQAMKEVAEVSKDLETRLLKTGMTPRLLGVCTDRSP